MNGKYGSLFGMTSKETKFGRAAKRWISPILFVLVWELVGRFELVDAFFLPQPTNIIKAMYRMAASGVLFEHMEASIYRALSGYILAALFGIGFGIAICWSRIIENILDPLFELMRPISTLALVPLMIIWFGIGNGSKIAIVFKACFFPILLNTVAGIRGVNLKLIQAGRSLGASELQLWSKVILPAAMPVIFTGMRISTAISMLAIVGVEMISSDSGLGFLIIDSERVFATDKMFVGILTLSALGFSMDYIARIAGRRFLSWHMGTLATGRI
jgi:ABC-type nitrate/sulfonate/bicarbonate transport system permease component